MNKIIFFTRAPKIGEGKTRLRPFLSDEERFLLQKKLINNIFNKIKATNIDFVIYFDGDATDLDFLSGEKKPQLGEEIGERMRNAIFNELDTCNKVILVGADLVNLKAEHLLSAFRMLDNNDVVISPTFDGGYGLVGMKEKLDIFSGIVYSTENVLKDTILKTKSLGKTYYLLPEIRDIDTILDLVCAEFDSDEIELLGAGEYNINFKFGGEVIRLNIASQMNLGKKQIAYEFGALEELETSGVTPKPIKYFENGKYIQFPFMTMEFVEGRPLEYYKDFDIASQMLAKIHSVDTNNSNLIFSNKPFLTMLKECESMFSVYKSWGKKDVDTEKRIDSILSIVKKSGVDERVDNPSIINTELNNRNFIIGKNSKIIDWEKPLIGEAEQDLAHFLVPTTTNWKTDVIFSKKDMMDFVAIYEKYRAVNYKKLNKYLRFNILRGMTWCSMAKVHYEKEGTFKHSETYKKINKFLSEEFYDVIKIFFMEEV